MSAYPQGYRHIYSYLGVDIPFVSNLNVCATLFAGAVTVFADAGTSMVFAKVEELDKSQEFA